MISEDSMVSFIQSQCNTKKTDGRVDFIRKRPIMPKIDINEVILRNILLDLEEDGYDFNTPMDQSSTSSALNTPSFQTPLSMDSVPLLTFRTDLSGWSDEVIEE